MILIPAPIRDENIPRKFVRSLNGDPLIAHAINIAKTKASSQNICVLTDDEEVQLIAERSGIVTSLYDNGLAVPRGFGEQNTVSILRQMENDRGKAFDFVIWMGASSPLLTHMDIEKAIGSLDDSSLDGIFSTSEIAQYKWKNTYAYLPFFGSIQINLEMFSTGRPVRFLS